MFSRGALPPRAKINLNKWFRLLNRGVNHTVRLIICGGFMKRIFTLTILAHWAMFFALHAFAALGGGGISADLPIGSMPLAAAGLGIVSLIIAALFVWSILVSLIEPLPGPAADADVLKTAFGCASLTFSTLSLIAIIRADPDMLLSSTVYFAALVVSWGAAWVEWELLSVRALKFKETEAVRVSRMMAGEAAWQTGLSRISGREGTS